MGLYRFPKEQRIRRKADFLRILKKGTKIQSAHFRIALCPNDQPYSRLGVAVGKRVGSAVERNRIKRLVREFFRLHKGFLSPSTDFVVAAKEGAASLSYLEVAEELKGMFRES